MQIEARTRDLSLRWVRRWGGFRDCPVNGGEVPQLRLDPPLQDAEVSENLLTEAAWILPEGVTECWGALHNFLSCH